MAALTKLRIREPLQGEQRAFYSAEGPQRAGQRVSGASSGQLPQNHRWQNDTGVDRCFEAHQFRPLANDRGRVDRVANQRFDQRVPSSPAQSLTRRSACRWGRRA